MHRKGLTNRNFNNNDEKLEKFQKKQSKPGLGITYSQSIILIRKKLKNYLVCNHVLNSQFKLQPTVSMCHG